MKFFAKCLAVFIGITILLVLGNELFLDNELPLAGTFLFSAFTSLLLTLLYGWIDAVYIQKRQPGL
jgi:hypothetical protein